MLEDGTLWRDKGRYRFDLRLRPKVCIGALRRELVERESFEEMASSRVAADWRVYFFA